MSEDLYLDAEIYGVEIFEHRFQERLNGADGFEIMFTCKRSDTGEEVETYLEISPNYCSGNLSTKRQIDVSLERLESLGYKHGNDLSKIAELAGTPCRLRGRLHNGKYYYSFCAESRKPLDSKTVADKMAKIMAQVSGKTTAPEPAPAAPAEDPEDNPFK